METQSKKQTRNTQKQTCVTCADNKESRLKLTGDHRGAGRLQDVRGTQEKQKQKYDGMLRGDKDTCYRQKHT